MGGLSCRQAGFEKPGFASNLVARHLTRFKCEAYGFVLLTWEHAAITA
jgi:hypothetical protein